MKEQRYRTNFSHSLSSTLNFPQTLNRDQFLSSFNHIFVVMAMHFYTPFFFIPASFKKKHFFL